MGYLVDKIRNFFPRKCIKGDVNNKMIFLAEYSKISKFIDFWSEPCFQVAHIWRCNSEQRKRHKQKPRCLRNALVFLHKSLDIAVKQRWEVKWQELALTGQAGSLLVQPLNVRLDPVDRALFNNFRQCRVLILFAWWKDYSNNKKFSNRYLEDLGIETDQCWCFCNNLDRSRCQPKGNNVNGGDRRL